MIIDFHTHIFPKRIIERRSDYCQRDICFSTLYSNSKAKMATVEDLIREMDECNVDKSVVLNIGWLDNDICIETNDYILESQARYPERIIGFCAVQPEAGDSAITELERCIKGGARGLGEMRPDVQGFDIDDSGTLAGLVDIIRENDLVFLTHSSEPVGHNYDGKGKVTPEFLYDFILINPQINIVCAHLGGGLPFYAFMPEVNTALEKVYYDTAASPYLYKPEIIKYISEIAGREKMLFGSDYPLMSQQRVISYIESSGIANDEKKRIFSENAKSLLKLT